MPKGVYERKKAVTAPPADLKAHEQAAWAVAEVLQERCGISGCVSKHHIEEASYLIRRFINLGIIIQEE